MSIHVEIVTAGRIAYTGEATEVNAPGFHGEFGVLPEHTPFLSVVRPGVIEITEVSGGTTRFVVGRGFVEAGPDRVTVLTELCEDPTAVDRSAAQQELDAAESTLASVDGGSAEAANANRKADLAQARLKA